MSTVFELAGTDRVGLLAEVIALLRDHGSEVRSAAVWTHHTRVAFVVSAAGGGVGDASELEKLNGLLRAVMDASGHSFVTILQVKGLIHFERRLHQLLLKEEEAAWSSSTTLGPRYEAILHHQDLAAKSSLPSAWASPACHSTSSHGDPSSSAAAPPPPLRPFPVRGLRLCGGGSGGGGRTRHHRRLGGLTPTHPSPDRHRRGRHPCNNHHQTRGPDDSDDAASRAGWMSRLQTPSPPHSPSMGDVPEGMCARMGQTDGAALVGGAAGGGGGERLHHPAPSRLLPTSALPQPADSSCGLALGLDPGDVHRQGLKASLRAAAPQIVTVLHATSCGPLVPRAAAAAVAAVAATANACAATANASMSTASAADRCASGDSVRSDSNSSGRTGLAASGGSEPLDWSSSTSLTFNGLQKGRSSSSSAYAASSASSGRSQHLQQQQQQQQVPLKTEIRVQAYRHLPYTTVCITCKDRKKLLFDIVCTLSDLDYDVYHAAVDCESEVATQLFYIRSRTGDNVWDIARAAKLHYFLESAIQRRFPQGLKVHIQASEQHDLAAPHTGTGLVSRLLMVALLLLPPAPWAANGVSAEVEGAAGGKGHEHGWPTGMHTPLGVPFPQTHGARSAWRDAGLWITRAKVRAHTGSSSAGHTFYLMSHTGGVPDVGSVQRACQSVGGRLIGGGNPGGDPATGVGCGANGGGAGGTGGGTGGGGFTVAGLGGPPPRRGPIPSSGGTPSNASPLGTLGTGSSFVGACIPRGGFAFAFLQRNFPGSPGASSFQ
ncbi:MAG: hypothetical protein WDW38_005087 [Sanguina aurantia]